MNKLVKVLSNGVEIPVIGFGTFKIPEGEDVIAAVSSALELGYRHIDTAAIYKNERGVGEAIRMSGLDRSSIFLTTKVWNDDRGYEQTLAAFEASIDRLGVDYLDLYLIHWPKEREQNRETWRALEQLYRDGRVRSIGVSNFKEHHLSDLLEYATIKPMVNQVEFHPLLQQTALHEYCYGEQIELEAWSPLMQGDVNACPEVAMLADVYDKSPAQIILRWHVQKGIITLPKTVTPARMKENLAVFDFSLSHEDMYLMNKLNREKRIGPDPDEITF